MVREGGLDDGLGANGSISGTMQTEVESAKDFPPVRREDHELKT